MKKSFEFELGQRVFILGKSGICRISGRGKMIFASGGKMNFYSLEGAYYGFHSEMSLISILDSRRLSET